MTNEHQADAFTGLLKIIRKSCRAGEIIPHFDPLNGNESAQYLFLMEAPGPKAISSGMVSYDNPDPSARNLREQLQQAGITLTK